MNETKEILYEKIADISESKSKIIEENNSLKVQLDEAKLKIESLEKKEEVEFIDRLNNILEAIAIDEKTGEIILIEEKFNQRNQEILMAKHFVKVITQKAKDSKPELDPSVIAREILRRVR